MKQLNKKSIPALLLVLFFTLASLSGCGVNPPCDGCDMPNDTVPSDTVPIDTVPNDTVPIDTIPNDTIPNDTVPMDTVPDDTIPNRYESAIGYIMDYVNCNGLISNENNDSARARGYNIISENLRDTFEAYYFPNNISMFPVDFFINIPNYRYSYKIEFEFEDIDFPLLICHGYFIFKYPNSRRIRVISANFIN